MLKKNMMYLLLFLLLAGCSSGKDLFLNQIDQLDQALDEPEWEQIKSQSNELKKMYQENKWKLQMLGDEGEYEQLNESINTLIAATKEEDTTSARLELATARTLITDIYSL